MNAVAEEITKKAEPLTAEQSRFVESIMNAPKGPVEQINRSFTSSNEKLIERKAKLVTDARAALEQAVRDNPHALESGGSFDVRLHPTTYEASVYLKPGKAAASMLSAGEANVEHLREALVELIKNKDRNPNLPPHLRDELRGRALTATPSELTALAEYVGGIEQAKQAATNLSAEGTRIGKFRTALVHLIEDGEKSPHITPTLRGIFKRNVLRANPSELTALADYAGGLNTILDEAGKIKEGLHINISTAAGDKTPRPLSFLITEGKPPTVIIQSEAEVEVKALEKLRNKLTPDPKSVSEAEQEALKQELARMQKALAEDKPVVVPTRTPLAAKAPAEQTYWAKITTGAEKLAKRAERNLAESPMRITAVYLGGILAVPAAFAAITAKNKPLVNENGEIVGSSNDERKRNTLIAAAGTAIAAGAALI